MNIASPYRLFFLFVYAIYLYFNKGVAYTYLSEITWVVGILLLLRNARRIHIAWGKVLGIFLVLLLVNIVQMAKGFTGYPLVMVLRDSFVLNYGIFMLIAFLFWEEREQFFNDIVGLYRFFPLVVTCTFLLRSFFPNLNEFKLFGEVPFLMYKNGDMAVHLLITVMLVLTGKLTWSNQRLAIFNYILLIYLLLIAATYSRGGLVAFVVPFSFFIYRSRKTPWAQNIKQYVKWVPLVIALALPLYLSTKVNVEDRVNGRYIGLGQLKDNAVSIVKRDAAKSDGLDGNVTWRLIWWGKIVDYTFFGPYKYWGKGLGVNLATDDDIAVEDDSLRSPHNFNMTILARFGVPIFIVWLLFLFYVFQPLLKKKLSAQVLLLGCSLMAFFINASFDVSLEGPMMAFPFWTLLGLYLMEQIPVHD